jgi:hypothetical protein
MFKKIIQSTFLFLLLSTSAYSATEDFTTYTFDDEPSVATFSTTSGTVTANNVRRQYWHHWYRDDGAGYWDEFSIDYDGLVDFSNNWSQSMHIAVGDDLNLNFNDLNTASDGVGVRYRLNGSTGNRDFILQNFNNSSTDVWSGASDNTTYYYTFAKDGSSISLEIYSDSGRTTLLDTLTVTHSSDTYRYLCVNCGFDTTNNETITKQVVSNMEITITSSSTRRRYF